MCCDMQYIYIFFTATSLGVNLLDALAVEDHASAGASEGLVGGGGDDVLKYSKQIIRYTHEGCVVVL